MKRLFFLFLLLPCFVYGQHGVQAVFKQVQENDIFHAYGGFQDSSAEIAITQGSWSKVGNAYGSLWGGLEANGVSMSGDTMTIANSGDYWGLVTFTFEGTNGNEYELRIYNVTQTSIEGFHLGESGRGAGNYSTLTMPIYVEATAGDKLVMQITNTDGNNNATAIFGSFIIIYLHD